MLCFLTQLRAANSASLSGRPAFVKASQPLENRVESRLAAQLQAISEKTTMRDVVVIGGGLSGLAAGYELERRGVRYTMIEVKPRFGGAIRSSSAGGFVMDAAALRLPAD